MVGLVGPRPGAAMVRARVASAEFATITNFLTEDSAPVTMKPPTMKLTRRRLWAILRGNSAATVADRKVPLNWGAARPFLVESLVAPRLSSPSGPRWYDLVDKI